MSKESDAKAAAEAERRERLRLSEEAAREADKSFEQNATDKSPPPAAR